MNTHQWYLMGLKQVILDPDAQAFINAAIITAPLQQNAINTLVVALKANSLWSKFKAIYPLVGGTEFSHKWNLKDPRDLDIAFRLLFVNTWTHSTTGATGGYANTYLNCLAILSQNSTHISYYSRSALNGNRCLIGAQVGGDNNLRMLPTYTGNALVECNSVSTGGNPTYSSTLGFWTTNRITSANSKFYKNGVLEFTRTSASTPPPNCNLYINATSANGTPLIFSGTQVAFATIGEGLTDADTSNLYTLIQAFQTTLGRQV